MDRRTLLTTLAGAGAAVLAGARIPALAGDAIPPVTIPRSEVHDLTHPVTGLTHRVMLWRPDAPPPPEGYPVVYLLDGNSVFGLATDTIQARTQRKTPTGMQPGVVVALGYPIADAYDLTRRSYDLTPPAETYVLPDRPNGQPWPPMGGADGYLDFIEEQVKPLVAKRLPIDPTRAALAGHSFGGLFTLHALFTRPESFATYVAASPSLWFNDGQGLAEAADFVKRAPALNPPRRLFLSIGAEEQTLTEDEEEEPQAARRRAWKAANRMVDNARDMAALLAGHPGLETTFRVFPAEDHSSVIPLYINYGLEYALAP